MKQENKNIILKYPLVMKKCLFILLMVFSTWSLTAQRTITFKYDDAGNRVKRYDNCPNETIELGSNLAFCSGGTLTLDAGEGFVSYTWNKVAGSRTLEVSQGGSYTVKAFDDEGCTYTGEVYVTENPLPSVNLGPDQLNLLPDAYVYLEPDTEYQSYQWTGIDNTCRILCIPMENVTANEVDIELTVTDENGCTGSGTVLLVKDISSPASKEAITEHVEENKLGADLEEVVYSIYPNPTEDRFYFTASNPEKVKRVELYSAHGSLIQTFMNIKQYPLKVDMYNQPKGIYLLSVREESNFRQFKIVYK
jgi:hypothetical protein